MSGNWDGIFEAYNKCNPSGILIFLSLTPPEIYADNAYLLLGDVQEILLEVLQALPLDNH